MTYEDSNAEKCDICGEITEDFEMMSGDIQACAVCRLDRRISDREAACDMALQEWKEER